MESLFLRDLSCVSKHTGQFPSLTDVVVPELFFDFYSTFPFDMTN